MAAPVGDRVIEGYVDLLVETGAGLVVIEYKTDTVASEAEVDSAPEGYTIVLGYVTVSGVAWAHGPWGRHEHDR